MHWALFIFSAFAAAPASQPATAASGPVHFEAITRTDPPLKLFVARIDLTDPRVRVTASPGGPDPDGAGPWETILAPTSEQARDHDFAVAVNATFFSHTEANSVGVYARGSPASSAQPVMIDGRFVSKERGGPAMLFRKNGAAEMVRLPVRIPQDARTIIGGSEQIVTFGKPTYSKEDEPAPRTAAGLADAGKTLVLLVADGRRDNYSVGLTLKELAREMIAQGCQSALNLDGGGSSTMVRKQSGKFAVVNSPSDGSQLIKTISIERPVAYVLGVRVEEGK